MINQLSLVVFSRWAKREKVLLKYKKLPRKKAVVKFI